MSSNYVNEWSTGLCDCTTDCHSCCLTCWCPCVAFGRTASILDKGQNSCCMMGCIFYALNLIFPYHGLSWTISMGYRTKLRELYGIRRGSCPDCMIHFCCLPCALCQEYRELQFQGFDMAVGWKGNAGERNIGVTLAPAGEEMTR